MCRVKACRDRSGFSFHMLVKLTRHVLMRELEPTSIRFVAGVLSFEGVGH